MFSPLSSLSASPKRPRTISPDAEQMLSLPRRPSNEEDHDDDEEDDDDDESVFHSLPPWVFGCNPRDLEEEEGGEIVSRYDFPSPSIHLKDLKFDASARFKLFPTNELVTVVERFEAYLADLEFEELSTICPGSGGSASASEWPGSYSGKTDRFANAVSKLDCSSHHDDIVKTLRRVLVLRNDEEVRGDDGDAGNRKILTMIHRLFIPNPLELTTCNQATMIVTQMLELYFADFLNLRDAITDKIISFSTFDSNEDDDDEIDVVLERDCLQQSAKKMEELVKRLDVVAKKVHKRMLKVMLSYRAPRRVAPLHAFLRGFPSNVRLSYGNPKTKTRECVSCIKMVDALQRGYELLKWKRALIRFKSHALPSIVWTSEVPECDPFKQVVRNDLLFLDDHEIDSLANYDLSSPTDDEDEQGGDEGDEGDEEETNQ